MHDQIMRATQSGSANYRQFLDESRTRYTAESPETLSWAQHFSNLYTKNSPEENGKLLKHRTEVYTT